MNEVKYERARELLEADLGDELVALDATGGNCFGFNAVAADVWRQLEEPKTFAALQSGLLAEYDVDPAQCRNELRLLLDELTEQGLIRARNQ